jgi:hypothetical protein
MPTLYISCKSHAIETLIDKSTLIRSTEIETEIWSWNSNMLELLLLGVLFIAAH